MKSCSASSSFAGSASFSVEYEETDEEALDTNPMYTFERVLSGTLRRPSVPWTRIDPISNQSFQAFLAEEAKGPKREKRLNLWAYSQPFQEIIRPERFVSRDQLVAQKGRFPIDSGGDEDNGRRDGEAQLQPQQPDKKEEEEEEEHQQQKDSPPQKGERRRRRRRRRP
mmetsp:Transcript_26555/g.44549  ORF Transcript_26555/g.44549 Transcript_26555/m.44549 type:complete len:168 (+) Transcript_26555:386-889(+)